MVRHIALSLMLLLLSTTVLFAADDPPESRPSLLAERTVEAINIDGYLNEESWNTSSFASGFLQFEPEEGKPASQETEVRILYTNNDVYIGAYLYDEEPDKATRQGL